jgi:two-component system sensor histidine kinase YesM
MIGFLKRLFLHNKIRKRMIMFFGLTTLLMFAVNLYTYYNARALALNMKDMFMSNIYLNELNGNIDRLQSNLKNYLYTRHSESFNEYSRYSSLLSNIPQEEQSEFFSAESLLLLDDIDNMVVTYLAEAEAAVNAKRGRDINECSLHFTEATKVFNYINLYINKLKLGQFEENVNSYKFITGRLNIIQILNIVIILAAVVFNILLILNFTFKLTRPIISLANSANEIYKGNFDVSLVEVDTDDEIRMMADAFNSMASSIKDQVDAIKGRAELEGLLKEQEMQNLLMKNLLKEAELQALQSQINPHFIYNTLNAGVQLAVLEDAERTSLFIENVANLLRYNMKMIDRPVTLGDEIKNVRSYMHILKVRFGNRIKFIQQVDESALDVSMPCMILQPLVENAYIHGISELDGAGVIKLAVKKTETAVEIVIEDNGRGMSEEKIKELLEGAEVNRRGRAAVNRHTTGIGLNNVIQRLSLFFNGDGILSIRSRPAAGTSVVIRLPLQDGGGNWEFS